MIQTILFDMGGTLDGDGTHWLERFLDLYRSRGVNLPRESIRAAFDEAERKSAVDERILTLDFARMVDLHVQWQLTHLGLMKPELRQHLVAGFIGPVHEATARNTKLLAGLAQQGFKLGVVSNGCGNVDRLCADFGYTPFLSIIVDSRRVGLFKPDPAIFQYAADQLGGDPATMLMIGDSFDRDVVPAKKIGMQTAWLEGPVMRECPDPTLADLRLQRLGDLPVALAAMTNNPATAVRFTEPSRQLTAGVLAAGHGRRLRTLSGSLKPLVQVGNKTLIEHVLNSMSDAGASEVVVIINEDSLAVRDHVMARKWPFVLRWIVETTPSSMHSFLRLIETLAADGAEGPFLLSTVDTVTSPNAYSKFINKAYQFDHSAVTLALTAPAADEKPLLVRLAHQSSEVIAIGPTAAPTPFATAGVYAVRPMILREADSARHDGLDALRAFLGRLLERGYPLAGIPITEAIDVDRPADIETATTLLQSAAS
jgi:putative hydrolase of the HAD superfamily